MGWKRLAPIILGVLLLLQPVMAVASSESPMVIHVYEDGSIIVEGTQTISLSDLGITQYGTSYSTVNIKCGENDFLIELVGYEESQLYNFTDVSISLSLEYSRVPAGSQTTDAINLVLGLKDNQGNSTKITVNLKGTTDIGSMNGTYSGKILISATGSSTDIIDTVSNLTIEDMAPFLMMMGVYLTEFNVKASGDSAEITVSFNIDYKTFYQIDNEDTVRDILSKLNVPLSVSLTYKIADNRTEYSTIITGGTNINEFMDALLTMPNSTLSFLTESKIVIPSATLEAESYSITLYEFLKAIHDNFEILPSKGTATMKTIDGKTVIEFKSPKLVAKNMSDIGDSIKAVRKVLSKLSKNNPSVMESKVKIKPEGFDAEILVRGVSTDTAKLSELSNVTIIPVAPPPPPPSSTTPTPGTTANTKDLFTLVIYGVIASIVAVVGVFGLKAIRR